MENKKREIAKFYKHIFSDEKLKERIGEKAKRIKNEEDLRKLIREEIIPLMKKFNVNFSEEELLEYEEKSLKELSEGDLEGISGGRGFLLKPAVWIGGGILAMAALGGAGAIVSQSANAETDPPVTRIIQDNSQFSQQEGKRFFDNSRKSIEKNIISELTTSYKKALKEKRVATDGKLLVIYTETEDPGKIIINGIFNDFTKTGESVLRVPAQVTTQDGKIKDVAGVGVEEGKNNKENIERKRDILGLNMLNTVTKTVVVETSPNVKNYCIGNRFFTCIENLENLVINGNDGQNLNLGGDTFSNCGDLTKVDFRGNFGNVIFEGNDFKKTKVESIDITADYVAVHHVGAKVNVNNGTKIFDSKASASFGTPVQAKKKIWYKPYERGIFTSVGDQARHMIEFFESNANSNLANLNDQTLRHFLEGLDSRALSSLLSDLRHVLSQVREAGDGNLYFNGRFRADFSVKTRIIKALQNAEKFVTQILENR